MPRYSVKSKSNLNTCHHDLQLIFNTVIVHLDLSILSGHRSTEDQQILVDKGVSQTLKSKHLESPSLAVDVAPYPIDWYFLNKKDSTLETQRELAKFYFLAGFVFSVAAKLLIPLRWGGAWKQRYVLNEPGSFQDLGHFELLTGEEKYRL